MDVDHIINHLLGIAASSPLPHWTSFRGAVTPAIGWHRQNWIFFENDSIMEKGKDVLIAINLVELNVERCE